MSIIMKIKWINIGVNPKIPASPAKNASGNC